jgi:hypothetical protein
MGLSLTGIASFASSVRVEMAGSSQVKPGHDGVAACAVRQQLRRLV